MRFYFGFLLQLMYAGIFFWSCLELGTLISMGFLVRLGYPWGILLLPQNHVLLKHFFILKQDELPHSDEDEKPKKFKIIGSTNVVSAKATGSMASFGETIETKIADHLIATVSWS